MLFKRSAIGTLALGFAAFSLQSALSIDSDVVEHHTFSNGANPSRLVLNRDGNLYGVTQRGGKYEGGTIFRISPAGKLKILHHFHVRKLPGGLAPVEGWGPTGKLAVADDGTVYGLAFGGPHDHNLIFSLTSEGVFSVLFEFPDQFPPAIRGGPQSLILTKNGDLAGCRDHDIFRLTKDGEYSVIRRFEVPENIDPNSPSKLYPPSFPKEIFEGDDGTLYATSRGGGFSSWSSPIGPGSFFMLDANNDPVVIGNPASGEPNAVVKRAEGGFLLFNAYGNVEQLSATGETEAIYTSVGYGHNIVRASNGNYTMIQWSGGGSKIHQITPGGEILPSVSFYAPNHSVGYDWIDEGSEELSQTADGRCFTIHLTYKPSYKSLRAEIVSLPFLHMPAFNVPPLAGKDTVDLKKLRVSKKSTSGNYEAVIDVLKNDSDVNGDPLSVTEITMPEHGTVEFDEATQSIRYTSATRQSDEFSYTISDGKGGTGSAKVALASKVNPSFEGVLEGEEGSSAIAKVAVTPKGKIGGQFTVNSKTYRFKSQLNLLGKSTVRIVDGEKISFVEIAAYCEGTDWKLMASLSGDAGSFSGECLPKKLNTFPK